MSANGHTDAAEWIEFTLSHEAMIGFATELLWMYESISDSRKMVVSTHQLQVDPSPNQALGFYLTPDSPMFVLKVNYLDEESEEDYEYANCKEINIKTKNVNQYYNVKEISDEDNELICLESYELSRKNIMNIRIFDKKEEDVNKGYSTVICEINRSGIKDFATMLLVWANNYKEGDEYTVPHIDNIEEGYNLGVILMQGSILAKFKCCDLGIATDYDSRF